MEKISIYNAKLPFLKKQYALFSKWAKRKGCLRMGKLFLVWLNSKNLFNEFLTVNFVNKEFIENNSVLCPEISQFFRDVNNSYLLDSLASIPAKTMATDEWKLYVDKKRLLQRLEIEKQRLDYEKLQPKQVIELKGWTAPKDLEDEWTHFRLSSNKKSV